MDLFSQLKNEWNIVKETIREEYDLSTAAYETWIMPLELYSAEENRITISIPSHKSEFLDYITKKYLTFFKVTLSEMTGRNIEVEFKLLTESENVENFVEKPAVQSTDLYIQANLNEKYVFNTFIIGNNNKFAHSAAMAVAESPGSVYNPLYIYGGPGLGKTHLMHSVGHYILDHNPGKKVLYVTSEQFTNEVIESIRSGNAAAMTNLRDKYRTVDVLMIDDIQFIIGKDSTQEEFFHTFNVLHSANKAIIISSDKPPKDLETLDERFRSRFEMGLICDIQAPDYETRMAILRSYAEESEIRISDDILDYISCNVTTNIRELEGAFNKIIFYSKLHNIDVMTLEDAKNTLSDLINPEKPNKITADIIMNTVASHYNITPDEIKSKKRNSELIEPRHIAMYLCREIIDLSFKDIAHLMNKKDHTTIIHAVNKIRDEMGISDELKNKVNLIRKKCSPE